MVDVVPVDGAGTAAGDPPRRLRIAHVTATFPPYQGGTGNVAYQNALHLALRGHEVHAFTPGAAVGYVQDPPGVQVHRLPSRFRVGNAPFAPGLGSALRGFDLVHLHHPFYFGGEQVWWSCARDRIPYVVTYHQDVLFTGKRGAVAKVHHALFGRRVLMGARFVAATTLDYARSSRLADLSGVRIVELPNGVDTRRFRPDVDTRWLRRRYHVDATSPIVLFVGALDRAHYFKGVSVLVAAMARLPGASLLVVGDGDRRAAYEQEARSALGDRARFAGRVPDADLPAYYAGADVVVLPSTTRGEAFGLVLIEAMAAARPVVASRLPGVRAVVDDGVSGLLVEPDDPVDLAAKVESLLADPVRSGEMGAAGRRKAEAQYDWRHIGRRLEQLYLETLGPAVMDSGRTGAG